MRCIKCGGDTRVLTTYKNEDGRVKRRRQCVECGVRFTTREHPELSSVELAEPAEQPEQPATED